MLEIVKKRLEEEARATRLWRRKIWSGAGISLRSLVSGAGGRGDWPMIGRI